MRFEKKKMHNAAPYVKRTSTTNNAFSQYFYLCLTSKTNLGYAPYQLYIQLFRVLGISLTLINTILT